MAQFMQQLLHHFDFDDWREFSDEELNPHNGFCTKAQLAFRPFCQDAAICAGQRHIDKLSLSLAQKQRELTFLAVGATGQKRAALRRQVLHYQEQLGLITQEVTAQTQKLEKVRELVQNQLAATRAWNRTKFPSLMEDFEQQAAEFRS